MAIKYFIAKCERKSSKHPEGNNKAFEFPVSGETQADAKESAKVLMEKQDPNFSETESTYGDWYKNPQLQRITEEEFNSLSLEQETDNSVPIAELSQDGTYSDESEDTEFSSFVYQNNGEQFKAAKVFIRQISDSEFAYGFKYKCDDFEKHDPMTLNHIEDNRDDAIESGISRLSDFLDVRDEQNVSEEESAFISALLAHDFYLEFEEPKEVITKPCENDKSPEAIEQIMDAISEHRQLPEAVQIFPDFFNTVESHMKKLWPNDKSPQLVIEHIDTMQTIDALYQYDVCSASFEQYLPQQDLPLSDKTIKAKNNIEKAFENQAANDSLFEPIIKINSIAWLDLTATLSTKQLSDECFAYSCEASSNDVKIAGDIEQYSAASYTSERDAVKAAGQELCNELMTLDDGLKHYKTFAHSPYVQHFEQNAKVAGKCVDPLKEAIRSRFDKRPSASTKDAEVEMAHEAIMSHVREDTVMDKLIDAISELQFCNAMYLEPNVKDFVALFTPSMFEEELKSNNTSESTSTNETESISKPEQSQEQETKTKESEPVQVVTQEIAEKEPANEPALNEIAQMTDLPEDYKDNPNLELWMKGFKTDLNHVKPDQNGRLSIKTQYRLMKATEIWGPVGVGWGYSVLREWIDTGAPIVMNGEITNHFEQIHKMEIEFWYMHKGQKVSITQYGDTRKLYLARGGYFVHDDEVEKKSLSDALGKAMSMVGICGDVYMGEYDDDQIISRSLDIKEAGSKVKRLEFDGETAESALQKAKSYTDKFTTAPSLAEIKRLEKLAKAALEAYPARDDEGKRKKQKAIDNVTDKANQAITDFNKDLGEQANG